MNCFHCGSTEIKEQEMAMVSSRFPERRREFCSWMCVVHFLNENPECQQDEHFTVYRYGRPFDIGRYGQNFI